jgi:hypothetical protein
MNKRNGLSFLITLLAMNVCLGLASLFVGLIMTETASSDLAARRAGLRSAAEAAALRCLSELQAVAGPDLAHTYQAKLGTLCIGRGLNKTEIGGEAEIDGLRWRWSVDDLSLGYDLIARPLAASHASAWARSHAGRPKLPVSLSIAPTREQLRAMEVGGASLYAAFGGDDLGPGNSWQVKGLLTDSLNGGWRRDLSDRAVLADAVGPRVAGTMLSPAWAQLPSRGRPLVYVREYGRTLSTFPLLTDFRLSLGFFNSRHDGRHRLRFHGSGVMWNHLSLPVLAGPQGRLFLCEIVGAPEVTVTNLDSGARMVVDLDDCPQEDFGAVRQGPRERGLWFWVEVADTEAFGMGGRGLLPGEVYAFLNPEEESQPQGLARILSKTTWRLDRRPHGPGWRRPGPDVFLPGDRIEVAVRFRQKVTLNLRPYAGEPSREQPVAAYPSAPVISLCDVTFPDFGFSTSGEDYSREDSAGYSLGERRACLRVRLRPRSASDFYAAAGAGRLQRAIWDFKRTEDASEWSVESPLLSALDVIDQDASPLAGPLWDLRVNRHDAAHPGTFASLRWRDMPGWPHLSVGSLRHFEQPSGTAWHDWLDRGFFSAPLTLSEVGVLSHQPFLASVGATANPHDMEAKDFYVLGPWNVNSRDPVAWESFLRACGSAWQADRGGPYEPMPLSGPLFFTRPAGAGQPKWGASLPLDLSDEGLSSLAPLAVQAAQGMQMVRRPDPGRLKIWANKLVELQAIHGWPFASLKAFAGSGLLERSLHESGINGAEALDTPGCPLRLEAGDLLEAWAPLLTVRGDTFKIVGIAESPAGVIACELRAQRVAEAHAQGLLGRKFRIISVQFRNP